MTIDIIDLLPFDLSGDWTMPFVANMPKPIAAWARDPEHMVAKRKGRETWYSHYMIRICKVERDYGRPDWPRD